MNKCEKVLLISNDDSIVDAVTTSLQSFCPNVYIVKSHTASDAVDKIMGNGFNITILDANLKHGDIKINDLIKINYASSKCLILLSKKSMKRKLEKIFHKSSADLSHIYNISGKNILEELHQCMKEYRVGKKPNFADTFKSIHEDIKNTKKNSIYKFDFLMLV